MKFSDVFTSKDSFRLDKKTLVFLRWIAIIGQLFTIVLVYYFLFYFVLVTTFLTILLYLFWYKVLVL